MCLKFLEFKRNRFTNKDYICEKVISLITKCTAFEAHFLFLQHCKKLLKSYLYEESEGIADNDLEKKIKKDLEIYVNQEVLFNRQYQTN